MTAPTTARVQTIIDTIAEQGANDPNKNKLLGHLELLDELAIHLLDALQRIDALERLLMPSTAVSRQSIGQRLKAASQEPT